MSLKSKARTPEPPSGLAQRPRTSLPSLNAAPRGDAAIILQQRNTIKNLKKAISDLEIELENKRRTVNNQRLSNSGTLDQLMKARKEVDALKKELVHAPERNTSVEVSILAAVLTSAIASREP